jgi:mRNA interferase RelE/StbE
LAWTIELPDTALRQLEKLDNNVKRRIWKFLHKRIASLENPRSIGAPLQGQRLGEFWRYRVGDYRLIAKVEDERLIVLVLRIGHRREIYR